MPELVIEKENSKIKLTLGEYYNAFREKDDRELIIEITEDGKKMEFIIRGIFNIILDFYGPLLEREENLIFDVVDLCGKQRLVIIPFPYEYKKEVTIKIANNCDEYGVSITLNDKEVKRILDWLYKEL